MISNLGGTAMLIGDPPNIRIAGHTELSYVAFIVNLTQSPRSAPSWRRWATTRPSGPRLRVSPEARRRVMALDAANAIEGPREMRRTVPILVATILVFFAHNALHLEPATVALAGATVMLLVTRQSVHDALAGIEWPTLFFLVGLFVMVGALEATRALEEVAEGIAAVTDGDRTAELLGILWVAGIGSGIVDNIPFTAAMIPVVDSLAADDAYWWALALGACYGGNATIVAAAAIVAASGMAARAGCPIGFLSFLKAGLPVTFVPLVLASAYVAIRYV